MKYRKNVCVSRRRDITGLPPVPSASPHTGFIRFPEASARSVSWRPGQPDAENTPARTKPVKDVFLDGCAWIPVFSSKFHRSVTIL
jgi:hypothetical protein